MHEQLSNRYAQRIAANDFFFYSLSLFFSIFPLNIQHTDTRKKNIWVRSTVSTTRSIEMTIFICLLHGPRCKVKSITKYQDLFCVFLNSTKIELSTVPFIVPGFARITYNHTCTMLVKTFRHCVRSAIYTGNKSKIQHFNSNILFPPSTHFGAHTKSAQQ